MNKLKGSRTNKRTNDKNEQMNYEPTNKWLNERNGERGPGVVKVTELSYPSLSHGML